MAHARVLRRFFWGAVLLGAFSAQAYPWMIRHDYIGCAACHADPSGSGLLTAYGRAQSELLLQTNYGNRPRPDAEATAASHFLWGLLDGLGRWDDWLLLGGGLRGAVLGSGTSSAPRIDTRYIQMQADLYGQVSFQKFRANASLGYAAQGAQLAAITNRPDKNLISREHWVGFDASDALLIRAGRINLPFGLRNVEHTAAVRTATRTDISSGQEYGIAAAYTGESFRGELMGIVGNFALQDDRFRERGYSGLIEYSPLPRTAIGMSSLVTHAQIDRIYRVETTRQAHGLFGRTAPIRPFVLLAEADVVSSPKRTGGTQWGYAGLFQADIEVLRGLHLVPAAEVVNLGPNSSTLGWGLWGTVNWFFAPHADIRLDFQRNDYPGGPVLYLGLINLHVFL